MWVWMSNTPPVYKRRKPNSIHFQRVHLDACVHVYKFFHLCGFACMQVCISGLCTILFSTWSCSSLINVWRDSYMSPVSPPLPPNKSSLGFFLSPAHSPTFWLDQVIHRNKKTTMRIIGSAEHMLWLFNLSTKLVGIYIVWTFKILFLLKC